MIQRLFASCIDGEGLNYSPKYCDCNFANSLLKISAEIYHGG